MTDGSGRRSSSSARSTSTSCCRLLACQAPGETVASEDLVVLGGGKAANTAAAAARLAPTVLVAAVGDDDFGRRGAGRSAAARGRHLRRSTIAGVPTGVAVVVTDPRATIRSSSLRVRTVGSDLTTCAAPWRPSASTTLGAALSAPRWPPLCRRLPSPRPPRRAAVIVNPSPVDGFARGAGLRPAAGRQRARGQRARSRGDARGIGAPLATRRTPVVVTLGAAGAMVVTTESATAVPAPGRRRRHHGSGRRLHGTLAASLVFPACVTRRGDGGGRHRRGILRLGARRQSLAVPWPLAPGWGVTPASGVRPGSSEQSRRLVADASRHVLRVERPRL